MHDANKNKTGIPRKVMTAIYIEDGIKLIEPKNDNQQVDSDTWLPSAKIGEVIRTRIHPGFNLMSIHPGLSN